MRSFLANFPSFFSGGGGGGGSTRSMCCEEDRCSAGGLLAARPPPSGPAGDHERDWPIVARRQRLLTPCMLVLEPHLN